MDFVAEPGRERRAMHPRPAVADAEPEHPSRERSPGDSPTARSVSRLSVGAAVALQRKAGNRAVSHLVAQRRAAVAAKPAASPVSKSATAGVKSPATGGAGGGTAAGGGDRGMAPPAEASVQRLADGK